MNFDNNTKMNKGKNGAIFVARVAVMSGMLTVLKFALSFVPNVEVITLLILVFASALGLSYALPATFVFCLVDMAIYGIGSWVVLYFVYWPLLAIVGALCLKNGNAIIATVIAVVGSILFGVLSACADTLCAVGFVPAEKLGEYFVAYYLRGLYFDLVHTVSNTVVVLALFAPLKKVCDLVNK